MHTNLQQLHESYASLGREFKVSFDKLLKSINEQRTEADILRRRINEADSALLAASKSAQSQIDTVVEEEKLRALEERQELLSQITSLINSQAETQESRLRSRFTTVNNHIESANNEFSIEHEAYSSGMDVLSTKTTELISMASKSREHVKVKVQADYAAANKCTESLQATTTSVHESTVRIVDEQMAQMDTQLHSLDEIITRVRAQNGHHHAAHTASLAALASTVEASYSSIGDHFTDSFSRIQELNGDMNTQTESLLNTLPSLASDGDIQTSLRELREDIRDQQLTEYTPTGETPQKTQYSYPSTLPRTDDHEALISRLRAKSQLEGLAEYARSPMKRMVFADTPQDEDDESSTQQRPMSSASSGGLRELDINVLSNDNNILAASTNTSLPLPSDSLSKVDSADMPPPLKRQNTTGFDKSNTFGSSDSKLPMKKSARTTVAGAAALTGALDRENLPVVDFSKSVGLESTRPGTGRRLRSHGSS